MPAKTVVYATDFVFLRMVFAKAVQALQVGFSSSLLPEILQFHFGIKPSRLLVSRGF